MAILRATDLVLFTFVVVALQFQTTSGISFEKFTHLSSEENQRLGEFKTRVEPVAYQDWMKKEIFLIRFLRASQFDVEKAVKWFENYVKWRKDSNMDTIHSEDWSEFERDFPYSVSGFDREERPIVLYHAEEWNIRKAALSGKMQQLNRYFEKMLDEIEVQVRIQQGLNKNVTQGVILIDLNRVNAAQHVNFVSLPFYLEAINSVIGRFPLLFDMIALVNTPDIFGVVLNIVTPLMDSYTRDAFMVFGKNREKWVPTIRKRIDPNQLPRNYGGNLD